MCMVPGAREEYQRFDTGPQLQIKIAGIKSPTPGSIGVQDRGKENYTDLEPLMIVPSLVTQILPTPSRGAAKRASTSTTGKKVVLFYPVYEGPALGPPLCILAFAAPLLNHGFEVVIIDAAINADAPQSILRECSDAHRINVRVEASTLILQ